MVKTNLCSGKSVGIIVVKNVPLSSEREFLCLYRLKSNPGLAFPAGHLEEGESFWQAAVRELQEETGLMVNIDSSSSSRLLLPIFNGIVHNPCGRGDYSGHEWQVFRFFLSACSGAPRLMEKDKHRFVRFMKIDEIFGYVDRGDCDPAWFNGILPRLALSQY